MTPTEKIKLVARLQGQLLREVGSGHPHWYAEMLVAAAYEGTLMPTNHKDYDIASDRWGRIQVKERVDGTDTTQNRTNFGRYEKGDFDHAAIVLFRSTYELLDAVIIPCDAVLPLVRAAGHVKWADVKEHPRSVSILPDLLAISDEVA